MFTCPTSNKVAWVVAGHEAVDPQPKKRSILFAVFFLQRVVKNSMGKV